MWLGNKVLHWHNDRTTLKSDFPQMLPLPKKSYNNKKNKNKKKCQLN